MKRIERQGKCSNKHEDVALVSSPKLLLYATNKRILYSSIISSSEYSETSSC